MRHRGNCAPSKVYHWLKDFPIEVPFAKWNWPSLPLAGPWWWLILAKIKWARYVGPWLVTAENTSCVYTLVRVRSISFSGSTRRCSFRWAPDKSLTNARSPLSQWRHAPGASPQVTHLTSRALGADLGEPLEWRQSYLIVPGEDPGRPREHTLRFVLLPMGKISQFAWLKAWKFY